ncbi:MAG TPA: tol-pal system-associated acyl-CoA thioesterase [Steroidobacteraceae bacterium]|nr:tol-pal system-associated acyl-CoA thioesterase [Steroidobacteraceae bacterium]
MSEFAWLTRVYWEDTDAGGVVYYANYLKFLERARTEWLRARGLSQWQIANEHAVLFTVVDVEIRYRKAARLDDELRVTCVPRPEGRVTVWFDQQIRRGDELLAEAAVRVACVQAATFRPCAVPDFIAKEFR